MPTRRYSRRGRRSKRTRRMPLMRSLRRYGISAPEKKYYEYWFNPALGTHITAPASFNGDESVGAYDIGTAWRTVSLLKNIPVGFSDGQRVGNEILVRYIQLAVFVSNFPNLPANAAVMGASGMICRYSVQRIRANNGNQSGATNFINDVTPTGTGPNVFNVGLFKRTANLRTHKTMLDAQHQSHTFGVVGDDRTTSGTRCIQHYLKVGRRVRYKADYSADPDMLDNSNMVTNDVLFAACANMSSCCVMQVRVRVCYQDN